MPNRLDINYCIEIANNRCGKLISTEYINNRQKLIWECKFGHRWQADLNHVRNSNRWCPQCAKNVKLTLDDCIEFAKFKNGRCLSTEYINNNTKMKWECCYKHSWFAAFGPIKHQEQWCPHCAGNFRLTFDDCIKAADKNNGKCISDKYNGVDGLLLWECKNGHRWKTSLYQVKNQNTWCPYCAKVAQLTITECKQIAEERLGKCLSTEYLNSKEHLVWECNKGHVWNATINNVKSKNSWCPECQHQVSSAQKYIYTLLKNTYPKLNINLNDTKTIRPLHLDIYIPELKLGIEYDGEYWHYSDWAIKAGSLERMARKDAICKDKNIRLLRINEKDWKNDRNKEKQKIIEVIK